MNAIAGIRNPPAPVAEALVALLALAALTAGLHGSALSTAWCCDDPQILLHAQRHAPWAYFLDPATWRALVPYSFTPWLTWSYDLDLALFGFSPGGFYLHHLLMLVLAAWALGLVARRFVPGPLAWVAAAGFLVSLPAAVSAQHLMVRHYVEGLFFFLVSVLLFLRALASGRPRDRAGVAAAYAVAVLCKEVFVPLGLLPLLMPLGGLRERLRAGAGYLLVIAVFLPWRAWMLGDWIGGYTPSGAGAADLLAAGAAQLAILPARAWAWPVVVGLAVAVLLAAAWPAWGRPRVILASLATTVALLAPLMPLVTYPGLGPGSERYFLVPWALGWLGLALRAGSARAAGRPLGLALLTLLPATVALLGMPAGRAATGDLLAMKQPFAAQGRFIAEAPAGTVVWSAPQIPAWFNQGLVALRPAMGRSDGPPHLVADESELPADAATGAPVWRLSADGLRMEAEGAAQAARLARWSTQLASRPMAVEARFDPVHKVLAWSIEPADGGRLTLVNTGAATPLPPRGALRVDRAPEGCFRVRHDAVDGTVAYTPPIPYPDVSGAAPSVWRGTGGPPGPAANAACAAPPPR